MAAPGYVVAAGLAGLLVPGEPDSVSAPPAARALADACRQA